VNLDKRRESLDHKYRLLVLECRRGAGLSKVRNQPMHSEWSSVPVITHQHAVDVVVNRLDYLHNTLRDFLNDSQHL
jgi:hypothetical protein